MRIYDPTLFVGLGGTGCQVGADLERRLREELCGPDGESVRHLLGSDFAPYQLPPFVQFIYADLANEQLQNTRASLVPAQHVSVIDSNASFTHKLIPPLDSYRQLRETLEYKVPDLIHGWLPPQEGEPTVAPLDKGAARMPTCARGCLFHALDANPDDILAPIDRAISSFARGQGALQTLAGPARRPRPAGAAPSANVFVAFSVCGGTGAGLFYDYLHLIWRAFDRQGWQPRIFPLVVLPSAFTDLKNPPPRRETSIIAGQALLDLFRLVDAQNTTSELPQRYPQQLGEFSISPGVVQTALLFSRPAGLSMTDLHRSVVSLVLSLIGTDLPQDAAQQYLSFADDFINGSGQRAQIGAAGVGNRGVSSSLVATLTVPVDDIAEIITSRLLSDAITELSEPPPGNAERNLTGIKAMFNACGLQELLDRTWLHEPAPEEPAKGQAAILESLRLRQDALSESLRQLQNTLTERVPRLARGLDYDRGITTLLNSYDPFRVGRIVFGSDSLSNEAERLGFTGLIAQRGQTPPPPREDITGAPPQLPQIKDGMAGLRPVRWSDPAIATTIQNQNDWYAWQTRVAWHSSWGREQRAWRRSLEALRGDLRNFLSLFTAFAARAREEHQGRCQDLYLQRQGSLHLLPDGGLDRFYDFFLRELRQIRDLQATDGAGAAVNEILGPDGWAEAFTVGYRRSESDAVLLVRSRIKEAVKNVFAGRHGGEAPLLPSLADLLARAAANESGQPDGWQNAFDRELSRLLPGGFVPQGDSGTSTQLVSYPTHAGRSDAIEALLRTRLALDEAAMAPSTSDTLAVVQFRTSMAVTDIREVRQVLRELADARVRTQPDDYLAWRQRLGYRPEWLLTTAAHRQRILHHLMCAIWNGRVEVLGDAKSPTQVDIRPTGRGGAISLPLTSFDKGISRWGSLMEAYERYVIDGESPVRMSACEALMSTTPEGVETGDLNPDPLFWTVLEVASREPQALAARINDGLPRNTRLKAKLWHQLWTEELAGAFLVPFSGVQFANAANLSELTEAARQERVDLAEAIIPGQASSADGEDPAMIVTHP